jgi:predicted dehydrogenase
MLNANQARDIQRQATEARVFAAEAMWSLFLPKFDVARQILASGMLGDITTLVTEYGEHYDPSNRIFDPALAGGPLLDLGTYPLALITSVLGSPNEVHAVGTPHHTGVNGQISAVMAFPNGSQATVNTQFHNFTPTTATIVGTRATLTFDTMFNRPAGFSVRFPDGKHLRYEEAVGSHVDGLHFQAAAAARAIALGATETPERTLDDSIATMDVIDAIRNQLGIVYPGE